MSDQTLTHTSSSVEELESHLDVQCKNEKLAGKSIALAVSGPAVLVCSFEVERAVIKDLKDHLMCEAVELLSLPADEVDFDFQVLETTPDKARGIFACCPKKLLKSYLAVLDQHRMSVVKIVPRIVASVNAFFLKGAPTEGRFALLDFVDRNKLDFSVFHNKSCELIREISFEVVEEAKAEVVQSLRSVCAKSREKQINVLYYSGDLPAKEVILNEAQRTFSVSLERNMATDLKDSLTAPDPFFVINLMRSREFTPQQRQQIIQLINLFLAIVTIGCITLGLKVNQTRKLITEINSSFQPADYDYARELEQKLKAL